MYFPRSDVAVPHVGVGEVALKIHLNKSMGFSARN